MEAKLSEKNLSFFVAERFASLILETPDFLRVFEDLYGVKGLEAVGNHPRFQALTVKLEALLAFLAQSENPNIGSLANEMVKRHLRAKVSTMMFIVAYDALEGMILPLGGCERLVGNLKKLKYAVAQIHDESAQSESARANQAFLESILDLSVDGVVTSDVAGNIVMANRAACGILGYNPTLPKSLDELIPEEGIEDHKRWIKEIVDKGDGTCEGHDTVLKSKDGKLVNVLLHHGLARHPVKNESCVIHYFKDITELKDIAQRIKERDELERTRDALKQLTEEQRRTIEALSTPILPVWGRTLLLPMIGRFDGFRFEELNERLLTETSQKKARFVILDLTGLTLDECGLARKMLELVDSLKLLGAQTLIVGIGPRLAKELFNAGITMDRVQTYTTLDQALRAVSGDEAFLAHKEGATLGQKTAGVRQG